MKLKRISEASMQEIVKAFSEYQYEAQEEAALLPVQRKIRHGGIYERVRLGWNQKWLVTYHQ